MVDALGHRLGYGGLSDNPPQAVTLVLRTAVKLIPTESREVACHVHRAVVCEGRHTPGLAGGIDAKVCVRSQEFLRRVKAPRILSRQRIP